MNCVEVFSRLSAEEGDSLWLDHWTEKEWRQLFAHTVEEDHRAGELVIQRGSQERSLYFVCRGHLEVCVIARDGMTLCPLARVGPGSVVGEQSFFDGRSRSAKVWAMDDVQLQRLSLEHFEAFAAEAPELARQLLFGLGVILSVRLRETTVRAAG